MKKFSVFLLSVVFLFSACSNSNDFEVGKSMSKVDSKYTPCININTLSVYKIDGKYLVTINDGSIILKLVEFSSDRKCIRVRGFDLIKNRDIEYFLNMNINTLAEKIGQPHLDVGSGFYIPAYVTDAANLICLKVENEIIVEVIIRDLFSNNIVARSNTD